MKYLSLLLFVAAVMITGCAQEAVYVDHEHGAASMDAYNRQIAFKDYRYAHKTDDSMDGIHAEPIMETYQTSFSEGFTMESIDTMSTGTGQ